MTELVTLSVDIADHVATVTLLERAMGPTFWDEIPSVFDGLSANPDVRAVVVHNVGQHFTYGLDLMRMMSVLGPLMTPNQMAAGRTDLRELVFRLQESFNAVARCRKPVIAALHGWCIGGGLDLAAACDIRLASQDCEISLRETKIAMVADLGSLQRLPLIIGQGWTRRLAFTAENLPADKALAIGLVQEVFPDRQRVIEAAKGLARQIAANPPLAVQGCKAVLNRAIDRQVADGLEHVATWNSAFLQSEDLTEAITAFAEKREPVFTGK